MIDLSIIVPTMNRSDDPEQDKKIEYALGHCLTSLLETTREIPIVVASNNGEMSPLPNLPGMETTRIKRINVVDQGQCKAVNAAVKTTTTRWILITNDDMVFPPGWLEVLTFPLDLISQGNKSVADIRCISPVLVEPNKGAPTFIQYECGGAGGDFDKKKFIDYVVNNPYKAILWRKGFNFPLLIRRDLWDTVGGYDINYDPWGSNSDSDLEYKIKLAGFQPYQNEAAKVYHFSQTSGTFNPRNNKYWQKNFAYFEQKWGFPRTDEGIWQATFEIPYEKLKYKPNWAVLPEVKEIK